MIRATSCSSPTPRWSPTCSAASSARTGSSDLDFASLEKVGSGYVSDDLREREDDLIWRVRFREGWLYVYLLLEFQSTVDRFMAVRILTYLGLLYQDLIRTGQLTARGLLPPVLPVVLYNGRRRWDAPRTSPRSSSRPRRPGSLPPAIALPAAGRGAIRRGELAPLRNVVAALFRLENSRSPDTVRDVLAALAGWLTAPEQESLRRAFVVWLKRVFLPGRMPGVEFSHLNELQEVRSMLDERVIEWSELWKQEGVEKGRLEGLQQGQQARAGPAAPRAPLWHAQDDQRARVRAADPETLLRWGERLLTARSVDDVLAG